MKFFKVKAPFGMEESTKEIFSIIDEQKSYVLSIDSALV